MELFDPSGHLTDRALLALVRNEELDELARLELAEHLAYCDRCLQRYTALLADVPLLVPAHSCRESLWRRIRARTIQIFTSRYAAAAAGVVLALTLVWGSGYGSIRLPELPEDPVAAHPGPDPPPPHQPVRHGGGRRGPGADGAVGQRRYFPSPAEAGPAGGPPAAPALAGAVERLAERRPLPVQCHV